MYSCGCSCGGDMSEQCNCGGGLYYGQSASFSMLYPYSSSSSDPYSSSSSVDCTLSLGTPSTRRTESDDLCRHRQQRSYASPGFCSWDVFRASPPPQTAQRSGRSTSSGGDALFTRRCANCDTTSTPLWRNGPRGPKSLCNACGIRYKKEEKRAAAAAVEAANMAGGGQERGEGVNNRYAGSWVPITLGNELGYGEVSDGEGDGGMNAFMSLRLNVADGNNLFHDFTS